ncbi:MAG: ribosome silencing factor [Oscillospiraceae bacterium]|jgi:ribosome-associated protein|nr:ribosome silencing factor [Oscillospiraceae bacterium]
MISPDALLKLAVRALDDKKGSDITVLRTRELTVLADYFVIVTANSTTQIKTLSDELEKVLKANDELPLHTEGYRSGGWVLCDYGVVVVHIFLKELRDFYNLERLWSDAPEIDIKGILQ